MEQLDEGSLVNAELSIGRHPAIVLSTSSEIAATGKVFVVAISANSTIDPENLVPVPPSGLDLPKKCYVQCGVRELLRVDQVESRHRKIWGPFKKKVLEQVRIATEKEKKATQA